MKIDVEIQVQDISVVAMNRPATFRYGSEFFMRCDEGKVVNLRTGLLHFATVFESNSEKAVPVALKVVLDQ